MNICWPALDASESAVSHEYCVTIWRRWKREFSEENYANLNVTWQFELYDNLSHSRIFHLANPTMKWFCLQTCAMFGDSCSITTIISASFRIVFVNNEIVVNLQSFEALEASMVANKTRRNSEDAHKSQLSYRANESLCILPWVAEISQLLQLQTSPRLSQNWAKSCRISFDVRIPFKAAQNRRLIK